MKRVDEEGPDALVQIREPVNKFPDFVRYAVQRLKALCPTLGKAKIADTLCRAGLHLGATTVGRMLKEPPRATPPEAAVSSDRVATAKYPNHVWHIDLTTVPTGAGFWAPWLPFALPQRWPFCWWLAVVIDHYSRRVMGALVHRFLRRAKRAIMSRCISCCTESQQERWQNGRACESAQNPPSSRLAPARQVRHAARHRVGPVRLHLKSIHATSASVTRVSAKDHPHDTAPRRSCATLQMTYMDRPANLRSE